MKVALISDAWHPQVNGVVTTLNQVCAQIRKLGHVVETVTPDQFRNFPCPTYPEIRLAVGCGSKVTRMLDGFAPDAIHIATEGPLGLTARRYCIKREIPFTTSLHTRFPEYVNLRFGLPLPWGYRLMRWFHRQSERVMVATPTLKAELEALDFPNLVLWSRGVDADLFRPRNKDFLPLPRPVFLYGGRVAVEKSVEDFLKLDLPGTKVLVGDGPQKAELQAKYPEARFVGSQYGDELASHFAAADVFVFPSRTDTFGLVLLEALACGVPVAAYPVPGPRDVITDPAVGRLDEDLRKASLDALGLNPVACRNYALRHTWEQCARLFLSHLAPIAKLPSRPAVWWRRSSTRRGA